MSRLGTRDLYESIERDRRARHTRNVMYVVLMAAMALAGLYGASLGLAHILDATRHLFSH